MGETEFLKLVKKRKKRLCLQIGKISSSCRSNTSSNSSNSFVCTVRHLTILEQ